MKPILAALLARAALSAHAGPGAARQIGLDTPGTLARVQQDNPAH